MGSEDEAVQLQQREACSRSLLWWLTYFGWTYRVKEVGADGVDRPARVQHVPFIPWPCQIRELSRLHRCVLEGRDVVGPKSRDMGYSWLVVSLATWFFLFRPESHILLSSRVEDLVDRPGDPDTLFWKIEYLIHSQPSYLLPVAKEHLLSGGRYRSHMSLSLPREFGNSSIMGCATTPHIGRAGRKLFIGFDEQAFVPFASESWQSASDSTSCRIAWSTPGAAGSKFDQLWESATLTGVPELSKLTYEEHPEKAAGGRWAVDADGRVTRRPGTVYWWSPWFERQLEKRDWLDLAMNVLCMRGLSGDAFFDSVALHWHLSASVVEPVRAELECDSMGHRWREHSRGRWFVYRPIPDATDRHVIFADPSWGQGSANCAACVMSVNGRELIAEFVDSATAPVPFAEVLAMAARTVFRGCEDQCMIGYEVNGPGGEFDGHLWRAGHFRIWRERRLGTVSESMTSRYGWTSNRDKKKAVLSALNRALIKRDLIPRSAQMLQEALRYVICSDGSIDIASRADLDTGAREAHGDRVIAAAGAWMMVKDDHRRREDHDSGVLEWPRGSFGREFGFPPPVEMT